jgi:[ribosomal protein S18]-alanine N-acetyltransferase
MMAVRFQVRPAGAEDLGGVVALERATPEAPHWAVGEYAAVLGESLGEVRRCLFVASVDGSLLGFAVGKVPGAGLEAELESVAVSIDARRLGVGRALCAAVIEWCRMQDAGAVELEVRASSGGAIALYTGLGWVEVGRRPAYYRDPTDDALLMRLELVA